MENKNTIFTGNEFIGDLKTDGERIQKVFGEAVDNMNNNVCKDENCEKCKELPKILRGKVTHKFPDLIQSEITPVKEAFNLK